MKDYMDVLTLFGVGPDESYSTLERELAEEIVSLHEHLEEDEAAIRVWRGRTLRAERFQDEGEWCDICDRPQWVEADGSHSCASIRELHATIRLLQKKLIEYVVLEK